MYKHDRIEFNCLCVSKVDWILCAKSDLERARTYLTFRFLGKLGARVENGSIPNWNVVVFGNVTLSHGLNSWSVARPLGTSRGTLEDFTLDYWKTTFNECCNFFYKPLFLKRPLNF